jgi:hypothetical protein
MTKRRKRKNEIEKSAKTEEVSQSQSQETMDEEGDMDLLQQTLSPLSLNASNQQQSTPIHTVSVSVDEDAMTMASNGET